MSRADVLNNTFKSVITKEDLSFLLILSDSVYTSIQEIDVAEPGVFSLLLQLDHHKAGGPDDISLPGFKGHQTNTEVRVLWNKGQATSMDLIIFSESITMCGN